MADLNSYKEVTQLSENIEYPDGYNVVEIIGTGDEKSIRSFPKVILTGPVTMSSNGITVATMTCTITDTSATNPFYMDPIVNEEVTPSDNCTLSLAYWATSKPRVFEDIGHTIEIPPSAMVYRENEIKILSTSGWKHSSAEVGWLGFGFPGPIPVYVDYAAQYTLSVRDGNQDGDEWWLYTPEEIAKKEAAYDPALDVAGFIYTDLAAVYECRSGTIGIPNILGQTVKVTFYYRPEAGDSGIAYLNAEFNNSSSTWPINVLRGSWDGCTITLSPDPGSIKPIIGKSTITADVTDRDGYPITGALLTFSLKGSNGSFNPPSGVTVSQLDLTEEIVSSSKTEFSTGHPIIKINSITAVGGGFTYNGRAVIRGSSVKLTDQEFSLEATPLVVNYDWGGQTTTVYTATGTKDGDKIFVSGTLGGGVNGLCTIDIDSNATNGEGAIDINADPSAIPKLGTSVITCVCVDAVGQGVSAGIDYTLIPLKGKLVMGASNEPIVNENASISDKKTCSVQYPIASVASIVSIVFQTNEFTAASVSGNQITINEDFEVVSGTATVSYTPMGVNTGIYTAEDEDYDVSINASYEGMIDTCAIKVGAGDPVSVTDATITVEANPLTLPVKSNATIKATLLVNEVGVEGREIIFSLASGFATLSAGSAMTDASGIAEITITSLSGGTKRVNARFGNLTGSAQVSFTAEEEEEEEVLLTLAPITILGWADPVTKTYQLTGGASLYDWGAADRCDNFGCTSEDILNGGWENYFKLRMSENEAIAWDIRSVAVSGGVLQTDLEGVVGSYLQKTDPFFFDSVEIGIAWPTELNDTSQIIPISDMNNENVSIAGATVKIAGQTATSDGEGNATFRNLPVGSHDIDITHPNYKDNRLGVAGGAGIEDANTKNDSYTVVNYSNETFRLKKLDINIQVTYTVVWKQYYLGYGPGSTKPSVTKEKEEEEAK